MPIPQAQSLTAIAVNSSIRVHERIVRIKGEDKRISSPEEAKAILAIPSSEVRWLENKNELPFAQLEAKNYLKYGNENLWDCITKAGKYIKHKGNLALDRLSSFLSNNRSIAQN